MRRVKELLRLAHELGYSKRQIAQSIRMPKTTVGDYKAIVPSIEGSAVATGFNTIWVDRRDPFWAGFQVV